MKDLEISPPALFRDSEQRMLFGKVTAYNFVLFCVLPLLSGIFVPYWFGLTERPFVELPIRLIVLTATGGLSFLIALVPAFLLWRARLLRKVYIFLLFPLSLFSLAAQAIMYREFGTEIDARAVGLLQGNFSALWTYACRRYHVDWGIVAIALASLVLTFWICRNGGRRRALSTRVCAVVGVLLIAAGTMAVGLRPDVERAAHYHPSKLMNAPLFQIMSFVGKHVVGSRDIGYREILERAGEVTVDERQEITNRLGAPPEEFSKRRVARPGWLKEQPEHVFVFLMESFGYDLVEDSSLQELVPCLVRYGEEGLSVSRFLAPSSRTVDAVHGMSSGAAPQDRYPVPRALLRYELDTLPKLMKRAGYKPLFLAASYRKFGSKGDVCEAYGYDSFISCPEVASGIKKNEWGVSDGDFFSWARGNLGNLASPHFVTFLNVSNHSPYDAPLHELGAEGVISETAISHFAGRTRDEKLRYARHIKYADKKMGEMAEFLHRRYPRALFVFVGDHGSAKMTRDPLNRVPLILWNDRVVDGSVDTSGWFGSHMDVLATLANLTLRDGEAFRSLGGPVWDVAGGRVSVSGDVLVSARGCLTFDGEWKGRVAAQWPSRAPTEAAPDSREIARKGSAIDALSWGYLNAKYLP